MPDLFIFALGFGLMCLVISAVVWWRNNRWRWIKREFDPEEEILYQKVKANLEIRRDMERAMKGLPPHA